MHFVLRSLSGTAFVLTLLVGVPAPAATITVDTLEDRIDRRVCSLRAAVESAHADRSVGGCKPGAPGADTIIFRQFLGGTIRLKSALTIQSDLLVDGPGRDRLGISGAVVSVAAPPGTRVDLTDLEMRTGLFVAGVGALNVRSVRFNSIGSQMSRASAIQVQGNRYGPIESISIRDSSFEGNEGGDSALAVVGETARLHVHASEFFGNAGDLSGAILFDGAGAIEVDISDSLFVANQAINGLSGAIATLDPAKLELSRNTFVHNRGYESGALFVVAETARIDNSVFYRNGSPNTGAIHIAYLTGNSGDSELLFSTLVDNDTAGWGPALVNHGPDPLWMRGNLMRAGNASRACRPQGLASLGYNLELDTGSCGLNGPGDVDQVQMTLYRTNGGTAAYPAPVPDPYHYAAVDAVPPFECSDLYGQSIDEDRLARTRPVDFQTGRPGHNCDVGAVELRSSDPLLLLP